MKAFSLETFVVYGIIRIYTHSYTYAQLEIVTAHTLLYLASTYVWELNKSSSIDGENSHLLLTVAHLGGSRVAELLSFSIIIQETY